MLTSRPYLQTEGAQDGPLKGTLPKKVSFQYHKQMKTTENLCNSVVFDLHFAFAFDPCPKTAEK